MSHDPMLNFLLTIRGNCPTSLRAVFNCGPGGGCRGLAPESRCAQSDIRLGLQSGHRTEMDKGITEYLISSMEIES